MMRNVKTDANNPQTTLRTKDFLVSRALMSSKASPFLALSLELTHLPETRGAIQALGQLGYTPQKLLQKFPNATAWAICASLLESYGQKSHEVWPVISRLFGKAPTVPARTEIANAFKSVCRKVGLVTDGLERNVDIFLIHVGVARSQLGHVAKAFLMQESAHGLPTADDVVQLNRWEDDAVISYLPLGVNVPERPILHDETAWMAAQYLQWRSDSFVLSQQGAFSADFASALDLAAKNINTSGTAAQPAPRLIWLDGRPQVQIPPGSGRLTVNVGMQSLRLRRGQTWPLPSPLPSEMAWLVDDEPCRLDLYDTPFVIFENEDGRQLVPRKGSQDWTVQTSAAIVTSAEPFEVDGLQAEIFGPTLYAASVNLRKQPVELRSASEYLKLRGSKRTRLTVEGEPIAKQINRPGNLWARDAAIFVEAALYSDQSITLKLEYAGVSALIECKLDADDVGHIPIELALSKLSIDRSIGPLRLLVTMMRSADGKLVETRIRREIFVWPDYIGMNGVALESGCAPTNFLQHDSSHILRDDFGKLCLDRAGGFDKAQIAFDIDGEIRLFQIDWPELSMVLERSNGTREHLKPGSAIIVGSRDWQSSLVVRSPNRNATLTIAGNNLTHPFAQTGSWAIPLRQLRNKTNNQIFLRRNTAKILLASIESTASPENIVVNHRSDGATARISVAFPIGGVLVSAERENGDVVLSETSFDHIPTDSPPVAAVRATKEAEKTTFISMRNTDDHDGLAIASVSLREIGSPNWIRLASNRGDRIALAIRGRALHPSTVDRLTCLDVWMAQCFAPECWDGGLGEILAQRWRQAIQDVDRQAGGRAAILQLVHKEETMANWLPMKHILEILPDLHSANATDFVALGTSTARDAKALSKLNDLSNGQLRNRPYIAPEAFAGFSNFHAASKGGEELSGFSGLKLIKILQVSPASRNFWDGKIILGPEHRVAALSNLLERCEDFRLFFEDASDGPMSLRSARLNQVMQSVIKSRVTDVQEGPEHKGHPVLHWIDQTLMAYAKAARTGTTSDFFEKAAMWTGLTDTQIAAAFGELLRLGPELFSFHLLCHELERLRP
jgi:hypothetical protein